MTYREGDEVERSTLIRPVPRATPPIHHTNQAHPNGRDRPDVSKQAISCLGLWHCGGGCSLQRLVPGVDLGIAWAVPCSQRQREADEDRGTLCQLRVATLDSRLSTLVPEMLGLLQKSAQKSIHFPLALYIRMTHNSNR